MQSTEPSIEPAAPTPAPCSTTEPGQRDARLENLKNFLEEWDVRSDPRRERKESSDEEQEAAKKYIYSKYIDHAAAEDKGLVGRWTETLNILLTFAGLQSAIVVAFILTLNPNFQPNPQDTSNQLLQQILYRLDNSTSVLASSNNWDVPTTVVRILAWWYVSLSCSLLSAFSTLLSKEWVLQYQNQPAWANTNQERAQLREIRYQGLNTWWFFAVIEFLPILLQLSLLFFAVGLAEYLNNISQPLSVIISTFLGIGIAFYILTLAVGTIFPSCPFKSPVSALLFRTRWTIQYFILAWKKAMWPLLKTVLMRTFGRQSDVKGAVSLLKRTLAHYGALSSGYDIERDRGESRMIWKQSAGAAGVLCWWLSEGEEEKLGGDGPEANAVTDAIVALPPTTFVDTFRQAGSLNDWAFTTASRVRNRLLSPTAAAQVTTRRLGTLHLADLLFHSMYHSPIADDVVFTIAWGELGVSYSSWCNMIRVAWTGGSVKDLPILAMRWPAVAVYLRYQLRDWCNPRADKEGNEEQDEEMHIRAQAEEIPNRAQVLRELQTVLRDPRSSDNVADVAIVASLAVVALVADDVPGVWQRKQLTQEGISSYEQLYLALNRLSLHFSPHTPGSETVGLLHSSRPEHAIICKLVKASRKSMALNSVEWHRTLLHPTGEPVKHPTLESGQLAEALLRLLDLGIFYRDSAPSLHTGPDPEEGQSEVDLKLALPKETLGLMDLIVDSFMERPEVYPQGLSPLSSLEGLARLLIGYAPKHDVVPFDESSLDILATVLGIRYHPPHSTSQFSRLFQPPVLLHPQTALPVSLLKDNPQILRQLIHDVEQVKGLNSAGQPYLPWAVVVLGRDLFLPPVLCERYSGLAQEKSLCINAMKKPGSSWVWNSDVSAAFSGFQRWDELARALRDLEELVNGRLDVEKLVVMSVEDRTPNAI